MKYVLLILVVACSKPELPQINVNCPETDTNDRVTLKAQTITLSQDNSILKDKLKEKEKDFVLLRDEFERLEHENKDIKEGYCHEE